MVYNPIFEEELESKVELKKLKKEIKQRARQESLRQTINRVYHLLQRKPILTMISIFHPITNLFKMARTKEV